MKTLLERKNLPFLMAGLGALGLALRWLLYTLAVDDRGLLPRGHVLEIGLWLVTAGAGALTAWKVLPLDGSNRYVDNFSPSLPAGLGHLVCALCIGLTVLLWEPAAAGALRTAWKVLGTVCVPCLIFAGFCRYTGRRPFFLAHTAPCLFFVVHIVSHYQLWSGDPQIQDYIFALLGAMALAFFCFYLTAFDVGSGRRRMLMTMGLGAIFFCMVDLAAPAYPLLNLGGIALAAFGLCQPDPKARYAAGEQK